MIGPPTHGTTNPVRPYITRVSPLVGAVLIAGCTKVNRAGLDGGTETGGLGDATGDQVDSLDGSDIDGGSTDGATTFGSTSDSGGDGDGDGDESAMDGGCTPVIDFGPIDGPITTDYAEVGWKWPIILRAGDFDGDTQGDVTYVAQTTTPSLAVVFGASSTELQVPALGEVAQIESGDVDGDGVDELFVTSLGSSSMEMLQFTMTREAVTTTIPWPQAALATPRVDVIDLDDDGSAEVLLAMEVSGSPATLDPTVFTASSDGTTGLTTWTPHALPQAVVDALASGEPNITFEPLQSTRVAPTSTTPGMVGVLYEWTTASSSGAFAWLIEQDTQGGLQAAMSTTVDLDGIDLARYPALFPVATGTIGLVLASDASGGWPAVWIDLQDPTLTETVVSPNALAVNTRGPEWEAPRVVDINGDGATEVIGNAGYPQGEPLQTLETDATGPTSFGPVFQRYCLEAADYALTNDLDQPVFVQLLSYCEAGC